MSLNNRDGCDNFRVYFVSFVSLQDIITRLLQASLSFFVGMTKFCTPSSFLCESNEYNSILFVRQHFDNTLYRNLHSFSLLHSEEEHDLN